MICNAYCIHSEQNFYVCDGELKILPYEFYKINKVDYSSIKITIFQDNDLYSKKQMCVSNIKYFFIDNVLINMYKPKVIDESILYVCEVTFDEYITQCIVKIGQKILL